MALRLRRGTDAQRQLITPEQGELIYVTDTTELYAGDGTTLGGIRITGEVVDTLNQLNDVDAALPQDGDVLIYDSATGDWIAAELPLVDLSDVNAAGILDGQVLAWDDTSSSFIPTNNIGGGGSTFNGDLVGSVFADDSTLLVDAVAGSIPATVISGTFTGGLVGDVADGADVVVVDSFNKQVNANVTSSDGTIILIRGTDGTDATFIGDVTGDVTGDVNGLLFGDSQGNHFGDVNAGDSSTVLDVYERALYANIYADDGSVVLTNGTDGTDASITAAITTTDISPLTDANGINFTTQDEPSKMIFQRESASAIGDTTPVGRLVFGYKVGNASPVTITSISVTNDQISFIPQPGGTPDYDNYMKLYKTGTVQISMAGEISTAPGDAKLEVGGAVLYKPMSTTDRNAMTAEAGMVIFNTTDTKLQVYTGSAWVDLH